MSKKNKHTGSSFQDYLAEAQKDIQRPAREWWLQRCGGVWVVVDKPPKGSLGFFHVIEHSAYQAVLDETERLNRECISLFLHEQRMDGLTKERDEAIQRATRAEAKLKAKEINGTLRGYDGMAEELAAAESEKIGHLQLIGELDKQLTAERERAEKTEKLYLEMRDGHEHVVHQMHSELTAERARSQKLVEVLSNARKGLQKIYNGSMFTPESEAKVIDKIITEALAEFEGEG